MWARIQPSPPAMTLSKLFWSVGPLYLRAGAHHAPCDLPVHHRRHHTYQLLHLHCARQHARGYRHHLHRAGLVHDPAPLHHQLQHRHRHRNGRSVDRSVGPGVGGWVATCLGRARYRRCLHALPLYSHDIFMCDERRILSHVRGARQADEREERSTHHQKPV